MRVLINALGAETGGAARHLQHFLPALLRHSSKLQYWLLCRQKFANLAGGDTIKYITLGSSSASGMISRFYIDNFFVAKLLKSHQIDCVVSLTNFGGLVYSVPHILFQRNALYYCPWYQNNIVGRAKIVNKLRSHYSFELMKRANTIVTPSVAMKEMILDCYPSLAIGKFKVLLHGYETVNFQVPLPVNIEQQLAGQHKKIFYPAMPAFHKGIFMIFEIIRELRLRGIVFKVYLCFTEAEARKEFGGARVPKDWSELCENICFLGKLSEQKMDSLFSRMDLVLYPSLCESFGFPLLEALGAGLPIVSSDTSVNREICGTASLYYPPLDCVLAADAVCSAFESQGARELKKQSQLRLSQFDWSWNRYVDQFVEMIQSV